MGGKSVKMLYVEKRPREIISDDIRLSVFGLYEAEGDSEDNPILDELILDEDLEFGSVELMAYFVTFEDAVNALEALSGVTFSVEDEGVLDEYDEEPEDSYEVADRMAVDTFIKGNNTRW